MCHTPMMTTAYEEIVYCVCCQTQMSRAMVNIIKRQREENEDELRNQSMLQLHELYGSA
jgi:hypothetical protein